MEVPDLEAAVAPGGRILMDDGNLELSVLDVTPTSVEARVVIGGPLSSHKGVNLPGAHLTIPGFTEKDQADLAFGIAQGVDAVAISFVRTAEDVNKVHRAVAALSNQQSATPIIAKLELPEAIENLHEIIHAADGVMVARGDLGVETSPALVPTLQKEIIRVANRHAKVVITATQMLDVWGHNRDLPEEAVQNDALSITRAARELAHDRDVAAIAVFTETGRTALFASKSRPRVPILAFTPVQQTYQRLGLLWGVTPFLIPYASTVESMLAHVEAAAVASFVLKPGQQIVLISGFPVGAMRQPNFALLHTLGDLP
jgi:pyruvate kinase